MRPLRSAPDDFKIRALAPCRFCGKTREYQARNYTALPAWTHSKN